MPLNYNKGFFHNVQGRVDKFSKAKQQVAKGVAIQCLADLQQESPVDYGRYRAGHTLTIMEPSSFTPPKVTKGEEQGHTQGDMLGKFNALVEKQITDAASKLGEIRVRHGLKIYITNNLDYAQYIEDGSYTDKPGAPKQVYGTVAARYDRILAQEIAKVE